MKRGKNDNNRVASPENVLVHLNSRDEMKNDGTVELQWLEH